MIRLLLKNHFNCNFCCSMHMQPRLFPCDLIGPHLKFVCPVLPLLTSCMLHFMFFFKVRFPIPGNILSLLMIQTSDLDLKPVFKTLISTLMISDSFCIIFSSLIFSVPCISHSYSLYIFPHLIPPILPMAQISLTNSVYITVAVAVERFMSVCQPLQQVREL